MVANKNIKNQQLAGHTKRELEFMLKEFFFNAARANWVRGYASKAAARNAALEQINIFLSVQNPNNPAVKYLLALARRDRHKFQIAAVNSPNAKKMFTSAEMDKNVKICEGKVDDVLQRLDKKIQNCSDNRTTDVQWNYAMGQAMGEMNQMKGLIALVTDGIQRVH